MPSRGLKMRDAGTVAVRRRPFAERRHVMPSPLSSKPRFSVAVTFLTRGALHGHRQREVAGDTSAGTPASLICLAPVMVGGVLAATFELRPRPDLGRGDVVHRLVDLQHGDDLGARPGCELAERAVGDLVGAGRRDGAGPHRRRHGLIRVRRGVLGAAAQREDLDLALVAAGGGGPGVGDAHGDRDELALLHRLGARGLAHGEVGRGARREREGAMATAATPMPRLDTLATVPRRRPKGQEISADPAEHLTELGVDPGAPVAMPVT